MIKKILLAIMIAIPTLVFGQGKFGVVNTQEIIEAMPEMKEIQTQIDNSSKKYEEEFQNLQANLNKQYEDLQKLDESTPQSIKDRRMQELQQGAQKLEEFRNTAMQDLQRQQQTLLQPVQERVKKALDSVGAEGGFTMIFENMIPVYIGADAVDVTSAVKAKLGI